jgi:hypothetical protein
MFNYEQFTLKRSLLNSNPSCIDWLVSPTFGGALVKRIFQSGSAIAASAAMIAAVGVVQGVAAQTPPYLGSFPRFETHLAPQQLPDDVDVALQHRLESEKKFPEVQRLFDLWS